MNKKQQKMMWVAGAVLGGVGIVTTVILLNSGNKDKIALNVPDKGKVPITPPATQQPANGGGYTPPAQQTSGYSYADTVAVQTLLYTYYPNTIKKIGDIGTGGKPDGIWGTNTQKVAQSVIANYGWTGVAQLIEWAKNGWIVYRREFTEDEQPDYLKGFAGLELNI